MNYKLHPAGYDAPVPKREYIKPSDGLVDAFGKWRERCASPPHREREFYYTLACELVKNLRPSLPEANALLIENQGRGRKPALTGLFISALYNRLPDTNIIFDLELETPFEYLGYRLPEGKRLINYGNCGSCVGFYASAAAIVNYGKAGQQMGSANSSLVINCGEAGYFMGQTSGLVINYGKAGRDMGWLAKGLVINCGEAGRRMGHKASGSVIAVRKPERFGTVKQAKLVLREKDCAKLPEFREYLEEFRGKLERGRNNYRAAVAALDELGPEPGKRLEQDITKILGRAGYNV